MIIHRNLLFSLWHVHRNLSLDWNPQHSSRTLLFESNARQHFPDMLLPQTFKMMTSYTFIFIWPTNKRKQQLIEKNICFTLNKCSFLPKFSSRLNVIQFITDKANSHYSENIHDPCSKLSTRSMRKLKVAPTPEHFKFQHWITAYVDIAGQGRRICKLIIINSGPRINRSN